MRTPTPEEARIFLADTDFVWHQSWEMAEGVPTPGTSPIDWLVAMAELPADLTGASVLDVGTNNGFVCFEAERRGASRVVGVDVASPTWFGFLALKDLYGSNAEYVQASVYELPTVLNEQFDFVVFLGVLYHLRHPLLALDGLRGLTRSVVYVETAVSDIELGAQQAARFYRRDELGGDGSNWFAPTAACLQEWCESAGFTTSTMKSWPPEAPERGLFAGTPSDGPPEYTVLSYERPLRVSENLGSTLLQGGDTISIRADRS